MNIHILKVWPEFYRDLEARRKTFEMRKTTDRDFKVGDTLRLEEWNNITQKYTNSPPLHYEVTHIMLGPRFGLAEGWCIMSIKPI